MLDGTKESCQEVCWLRSSCSEREHQSTTSWKLPLLIARYDSRHCCRRQLRRAPLGCRLDTIVVTAVVLLRAHAELEDMSGGSSTPTGMETLFPYPARLHVLAEHSSVAATGPARPAITGTFRATMQDESRQLAVVVMTNNNNPSGHGGCARPLQLSLRDPRPYHHPNC